MALHFLQFSEASRPDHVVEPIDSNRHPMPGFRPTYASARAARQCARPLRVAVLLPLALLGACGDGMTDAERKAKDEADNAYVENLKGVNPPPEPIQPLVIGYPDIEAYKLSGASCSFAPDTSLGAVAMAMEDTAWLKIEGHMVRLAADKGGNELPMGAWEHYDGKAYQLDLKLDRDEAGQSGTETVNYPARLEVYDQYKQLVYAADGTAQCSA